MLGLKGRMQQPEDVERRSAAALWAPLRHFIAGEARLGALAQRHRSTAIAYEFLRFGVKQAWACLFGGIMLALLVATHLWYPADAPLARYDFLVLAALAVQIALVARKLEAFEEAKVILLFHVVGTLMEVFKISVGSWIYPEPSILRIAGVPLFSGFMYASIGSYLARAWRLFDFRFTHHPPMWSVMALCGAIYLNFYSHHYGPDLRLGLFGVTGLMFGRTMIHYRIWRVYRSMPLLLGWGLVALFIWFAENIGTFTRTWLYPNQLHGWSLVTLGKLSSWFLLLIISYALVALVNRPRSLGQRALETIVPADSAPLASPSE